MRPRIFVGSSIEHLDLAYAAQEGLEHDAEVTVWSQGVFKLSRTSIASLIDELERVDFGLFILAPDDVATIRGQASSAVRDNVIFELGLFAGRLGAERCFMVVPRAAEDLHLPSDLLGLAPATFDADRQDGNMLAALGPACNRIRKSVQQLGKFEDTRVAAADLSPKRALCEDPDDCIAFIQSWMGARPSSDNRRAMRYDEVDQVLALKPGSARMYIEIAANKWGYVVERKGKDTILFTKPTSSQFY